MIFFFIIFITAFALIFTIINFKYTTTISLIFITLENIPGIFLLYLGIIIGAILSIPFLFSYSRRYANNKLNKSIKIETKRLKQEEKQIKKKQGSLHLKTKHGTNKIN